MAGTAGDVTLMSAGAIIDGPGKIIADLLVLGASGPIAVDTTVNILTATHEDSLTVTETDGITLTTAITSLALATEQSGDVAVNESDDLMLLDIQVADGVFSVNGGHIDIVGAISARDVTFLATDVVLAAGSVVFAQTLEVTASSGISVETSVDVIIAMVTGSGDIEITEEDAVTLEEVSTFDGSIVITSGGDITVVLIESLTDSHENDIALTTTAGSIVATEILAGELGDVSLESAGDLTVNVWADEIFARATGAIVLIRLDRTAPAAPIVAAMTTDSGTLGDGITNDNTLTLSGTAEAYSMVEVSIDGIPTGATTADDAGNWTYTTATLTDTTHAFTATATDAAGNVSVASAVFNVVIDTIAPSATVNALTTADTTPQLTGTVDDPSAVVLVTVAGQTYGVTNHGDGTWTLTDGTMSLPLEGGTYDVTVTATDAAENVGTGAGTGALVIRTGQVQVAVDTLVTTTLGSTRYDLRTGRTSVLMTITNVSPTVIRGPLWVVITSISDGITLAGGSGFTSDGHWYVDVSSLLSGGQLNPGQSVSVRLSFNNPLRRRFNFLYSIRGVI